MDKPILLLNGVSYDIEGATKNAQILIGDLATIQKEQDRIKIQHDIASLAKNSVLEQLDGMIKTGTSGFMEVPEEQSAD